MEKLVMDGIEGIEKDGREKSEGEAGPAAEESGFEVAASRDGGWDGPESSPIRLSQLVGGCGSVLSSGLDFVDGDLLAGEEGGLLSAAGLLAAVGWWTSSSSSEYLLARRGLSLLPARMGLSGG